jgi:hypothetical protein
MTALYPSTSAAQVFVPLPTLLETTGGSAPIQQTFAPVGTLGDLVLVIVDSAGTTVCNAALDALPGSITVPVIGQGIAIVNVPVGRFTVAGQYVVLLGYTPDPDYAAARTSFQWGGWIDTLMANTTSTEALVSAPSYWATNRVDVDDTSAPTLLTLFDTDGTTPLATRTIANADGSPVDPRQVLILGALTPVP